MPLGLEDGRVDKAQMTSSSYNNVNDGPWNARLNSGRGWSPRRNDRTRFLQIDFQAMTKVTRVATQGKRYANSWVTKYYIKYGKTKSRFIPYRVGRKIKVGFLLLSVYVCYSRTVLWGHVKDTKRNCHSEKWKGTRISKSKSDRKSHFDDNKSNCSEDDLHTSRNDYHDNKYALFAAEPRIRLTRTYRYSVLSTTQYWKVLGENSHINNHVLEHWIFN